MSKVGHSERGSVISDCRSCIFYFVFAFAVHVKCYFAKTGRITHPCILECYAEVFEKNCNNISHMTCSKRRVKYTPSCAVTLIGGKLVMICHLLRVYEMDESTTHIHD